MSKPNNKNSLTNSGQDNLDSKKFEKMARRKKSSSVSVSKNTCAAQTTQQRSQNSNFNEYRYRIYYEDTDAGGIVYYGNFLRFFERARTDLLRASNISQTDLVKKENLIFVVKKCEIDYLAPARLDDVIEVTAQTKEIGTASIKMHQEVKCDGKILCTLEVVLVCVDKESFKPKKIPENIKNIFDVR